MPISDVPHRSRNCGIILAAKRLSSSSLCASAVLTFNFIAFCVDFLGSKSGEFVDVGAAGREECGDGDPAFLSDDVTMGA